jgi:hypothetical protein
MFVNKMKQEIIDLQQKTQIITYERKLASIEIPKLQQVIEEKTKIHQMALSRLRWRQELSKRRLFTHFQPPIANDSDLCNPIRSSHRQEEEEKEEKEKSKNGTEDVADTISTLEKASNVTFAMNAAPEAATETGRNISDGGNIEANFQKTKEKLIHKKESTAERQQKMDSLRTYVGSPFKDDGLFGAFRQVGINKPEEVQLYWQDQLNHTMQLEAEEKEAEQKVHEYKEKLDALQTQLMNLKLNGNTTTTTTITTNNNQNTTSSTLSTVAATTEGSTLPSSIGSSSNISTIVGASSSGVTIMPPSHNNNNNNNNTSPPNTAADVQKGQNIKLLDQQLEEVLASGQQKKERAVRLKNLSEKLHLGLLHLANIFGIIAPNDMDTIALMDSIEQIVRLSLGDETHLPSSSGTFRHKNSVRKRLSVQAGNHEIFPSDSRTMEEKVKYNIRITKVEQRGKLNPYLFYPLDKTESRIDKSANEFGEEQSDEDDEVEEDPKYQRSMIKNRSKQEIDRKQRTNQKRAEKKLPTTGASGFIKKSTPKAANE